MSERKRKHSSDSKERDSKPTKGLGGYVHKRAAGATFSGNDQVLERCSGCTVKGDDAILIGCDDCTVIGNRATIYKSSNCKTTGIGCRFIECQDVNDSGNSARVFSSTVKASAGGGGAVTVMNGIASQASGLVPDGFKLIPDGERTVMSQTLTFGNVYTPGGRGNILLRKTADGRTTINNIEVPDGTTSTAGKIFYKGKQVTRADKALLEEVPAFVVVLDSLESGKPAEAPRQIQVVMPNGSRTTYSLPGRIINNFF